MVNVLTHCNAGSLATINYGTATAPIYFAQQRGIDVHVWVDETRPRNQGSQLTTWETRRERRAAHALSSTTQVGHLMQHGEVDIVHHGHPTGQRAAATWPTRSALTSRRWRHDDNDIPFYVATAVDYDRLAVSGRHPRNPNRGTRT